MITFKNLTYFYPESHTPAIFNLDLDIETGEFVLVIGSSGSGKTTFLRCVNGLIPHSWGGKFQGEVIVSGRNTKECTVAELSTLVSFVFQDPQGQFVTRKVEDELAFGLENLGTPQEIMRKRVEEALDQISINDLRARDVETLSGGERQKVAIGAALVMQPQIIVLDEPTSELDPNSAEEVLTILQKLNHDLGITVILSEHRLERVVQYADRVLEIEKCNSEKYRPQQKFRYGVPRHVLKQTSNNPPLVALGKELGWEPFPLTVKEGKSCAKELIKEKPLFRMEKQPKEGKESLKPIVEISGLWFAYGSSQVLKDINLEIKRSEFVAIMGRNGSGKTTLIKNLVGLFKPERGKVKVLGIDTRKERLENIVRHIGYIPQNPSSLLFSDTVEDELKFTLKSHNLAYQNVLKLLKEFDLEEHIESYPRDLSRGEQQRVALAQGIVFNPEIIILDEPTHGLDYLSKKFLVDFLKGLVSKGKTIVMVTHDVELVARCASRVILLAQGEVVVDGDMRTVLSESMIFSPQINKLLGKSLMTVDDVMLWKRT